MGGTAYQIKPWCAVLALLLACTTSPPAAPVPASGPSTPPPTIRERLGEWSFLTLIDAPATVALTAGGEIPASAETCGACHTDHFAEWSESTHASAIRDLQYLAELSKPEQPVWLCLNCHAPTPAQRAESFDLDTRFTRAGSIATIESTPNPHFDPAREAEGVGCATCHVRRDDDGAGLVVGPRGSGRAPHRVRKDPEALTDICVSCHAPGDMVISPTFVCWFDTADELAAGPNAGDGCPSCHMPAGERAAATGGPALALRTHTFVGGPLPKHRQQLSGLVDRGFQPGFDVSVQLDPLRVTLANSRAGHAVPTGDPERHLEVRVRASGAGGGREWIERLGQTWDWGDSQTGRVAHKVADTRLAPGETRELRPALDLTGTDSILVEVRHVRLTTENAKYAAETKILPSLVTLWPEAVSKLPELSSYYPLSVVVFREQLSLGNGARTSTPYRELLAE